MNVENNETYPSPDEDILEEYDFTGAEQGKHYLDYRKGHTVTIHKENGTTVIQHFTMEEGVVMLDPDLREYFPNAESVNDTLRKLIHLIPSKQAE